MALKLRITDQNFLDFFPHKSVLMAELTQAWAIGKLQEHYPNYTTRGQTQSQITQCIFLYISKPVLKHEISLKLTPL